MKTQFLFVLKAMTAFIQKDKLFVLNELFDWPR